MRGICWSRELVVHAWHGSRKRGVSRQLRLSLALQEPIHADAERAGRVPTHEEGPGL